MAASTASRPTTDRPRIAVPLTRVQAACLQSDAVYRGLVGGRGSGKSFVGAYDLLRRAKGGRLYLAANPTYPNLRDTTMRTFRRLGVKLGRLVSMREGSEPAAKIRTDTGTADVIFRSTRDPELLRGPNLSGAWLDEASLMKRSVFDITIAALREAGEAGWLLATYTPKGKSSWTAQRLQSGAPNTAFFRTKTSDNPFNDAGFEDRLRQQYSPRLVAQELEAETLDDGDAAVKWEDVIDCEADKCLWPSGRPEGRPLCYMGIDVGRSRDRSVFWLWEKVGDVLWCRVLRVLHQTPFAQQFAAACDLLATGCVAKCQIDAGYNPQFAEDLTRRFPRVVEGVHLSSGLQGKLAQQMDNAFSKKAVRIPEDEDLRNDFQLVTAPTIANGRTIVKTERDEDLGHADRFWAAALALDAALWTAPRGAKRGPVYR